MQNSHLPGRFLRGPTAARSQRTSGERTSGERNPAFALAGVGVMVGATVALVVIVGLLVFYLA